jgi:hypothetical protein
MPNREMLIAATMHVGALMLGSAVCWQVVEHADSRDCEAVVHVTEAEVDVMIDGSEYRVEAWRPSPIVCELRPGRHTLRMTRGGRVLYEEAFTLGPGDDIVLTAWDELHSKRSRHSSPTCGPLKQIREVGSAK